jgi:hypothetical protein
MLSATADGAFYSPHPIAYYGPLVLLEFGFNFFNIVAFLVNRQAVDLD